MLERYVQYGWSKKAICRKWGISVQTFYTLGMKRANSKKSHRIRFNQIRDSEKDRVIAYALEHTELNHREMAYRMIDEDVAFMSSSSVYRILRENNLIHTRKRREIMNTWNPHAMLSGPDEVWQTDLMSIQYGHRDYYLLTYIDVYSRFVIYQELCIIMTGDSIREATKRVFERTGKKPEVIQSDNGSCYISSEYRGFMLKMNIRHHRIHPHCPNENAEIERYHRTLRELIEPQDATDYDALQELIKEQVHYYNYVKYHSAIGYITPYAKYTGQAEKIIESRKQKLERAKQLRIRCNSEQFFKENEPIKTREAA
jgi:putative transposase